MKEASRKKFILLSKVAKERKYAQEYLSLLARRGDIGSIRIGKRWYTTNEWVEEFIKENQEKKKAVKAEKMVSAETAEKAESKKKDIFVEFSQPPVVKIRKPIPVFAEQNERKSFADVYKLNGIKYSPKVSLRREKRITDRMREKVPVRPVTVGRDAFSEKRRLFFEIRAREKIRRDKRGTESAERHLREIAARQRMQRRSQPEDFGFDARTGFTSPNFAGRGGLQEVFSFRFAYAAAFVLLFFLLISSAFVFREEVKMAILGQGSGKVAGAMSDKSGGMPEEENGDSLFQARRTAGFYLASINDKMKESFSFSHVMLRTALEKTVESPE